MFRVVKRFAVDFWHAMGNRRNSLKAFQDAAIFLGVLLYLLAVLGLAQVLDG